MLVRLCLQNLCFWLSITLRLFNRNFRMEGPRTRLFRRHPHFARINSPFLYSLPICIQRRYAVVAIVAVSRFRELARFALSFRGTTIKIRVCDGYEVRYPSKNVPQERSSSKSNARVVAAQAPCAALYTTNPIGNERRAAEERGTLLRYSVCMHLPSRV